MFMLSSEILGPTSIKSCVLFHTDMKFRVVLNRMIYKYIIWIVRVLLYFVSEKRRFIGPDVFPRITSITRMDSVLNNRGYKFTKLFWNELYFYEINNFAKCVHLFYFILKWRNIYFFILYTTLMLTF